VVTPYRGLPGSRYLHRVPQPDATEPYAALVNRSLPTSL
jgi:hypothetical protein